MMRRTKTLALSLALPALLLPIAEELQFKAEEGAEYSVENVSSNDMELTSMEVSVSRDGEEVHSGQREIEIAVIFNHSTGFSDIFGEVEDGRPMRIERSFEGLTKTSDESVTPEEGEASENNWEGASPLEGRTVVFVWDEEEQEYELELEGEDDIDQEVLDKLQPHYGFRDLLPDEEVEEGDSWEVPASAYAELRHPSGDTSCELIGKDAAPDFGSQYTDNLEGSLEATHAGAVEDSDGKLIRIQLTGELSTQMEAEREIEHEAAEGTVTHSVENSLEIEGEAIWDVENGRLSSVRLEMNQVSTLTISQVVRPENAPFEVQEVIQTLVMEGTGILELTLE